MLSTEAGAHVTSISCSGSLLSARAMEYGPGEPGREEVPFKGPGAARLNEWRWLWDAGLDSGCSADAPGVLMGELPITESVTRMEGVLCSSSAELKAGSGESDKADRAAKKAQLLPV